MRLKDIFDSRSEVPNFPAHFTGFQPPLNMHALHLQRALVGRDPIAVPLDTGVVGVLQLLYKGHAGGALGIAENNEGETWYIPQVQGARGRKAFRIASGLRWDELLANEVKACTQVPGAVVKHLTMPPDHSITNIDEAASEDVMRRYARVRRSLGMTWSDADQTFVVDVRKQTPSVIFDGEQLK